MGAARLSNRFRTNFQLGTLLSVENHSFFAPASLYPLADAPENINYLGIKLIKRPGTDTEVKRRCEAGDRNPRAKNPLVSTLFASLHYRASLPSLAFFSLASRESLREIPRELSRDQRGLAARSYVFRSRTAAWFVRFLLLSR